MEMMESTESQSRGFSFSECSSLLERQTRILSELKDQASILPKKVKTEDSCQADEEQLGQHDIKIEYQQAMDEFKKLKFAFIQLKSRTNLLDYLENVPRDEWPSVISCDEESKKARRQLKDAKTEASELQDHLQMMIMKQVQNCQETLDNKLESLDRTIEDTNDVAAQIEQEIGVRSSEALAPFKGSGINLENFQEIFDKQKEELESVESFLSHYEPVMTRIQEGTESLRKEQQMLLAKTQKASKDLSQQLEEKSHKGKQESEKRNWCESASKMLTELSGVSERSFEDNCWTLELSTAGCIPGLKDGMTALLSLHFKPDTEAWTTKQLISATSDTDTLEISDLVQEAVRRNNVTFLVSAVMKRFRTHAPLFLEVEQLRHQYAIDWVPEDGILRVIFGDSAQIVCTLSLATGPQGSTVVHLKSIEGVGQHPPIEEFKPSQQSPRISDWLDYLQEAVKDL